MAAQQTKTGEETRMAENREQRGRAEQQGGRERGSRGLQPREMAGGGLSPFGFGPFALIRRMQEDIDRLFGGAPLARPGSGTAGAASPQADVATMSDWIPAIETFQRGNDFVIRLDLPGVNLDDVTVEINEDAVTIRGERREGREDERDGATYREVSYGSFVRAVPLPQGAITENAAAEFKDGVLEILVPAPSPEAQRGRRLEIQQTSGQGQGRDQRGERGSNRSA